jgi:tetratricopeptide (TPR) repeat protein
MRSGDRCRLPGAALLVLACAGLAGCASVGSMFKSVPLGGPAVASTSDAATPAPAATASASPPAQVPATPIASPAERAAAAERAGTAPGATGSALIAAPASSVSSAAAQQRARDPDAPVAAAVQRAYDEARRQLRAGNLAEAEKGLKALTQSNPDLGGPHANLALLYRNAGKLAEAAAEGEKAVGANPKQPIYFNQLGITYRQNGQFAKAREAYEAAIALDPAYASPHLNLGILHDLYLADGKRALELYDKYLSLSPGGDAVVAKWVADLKNRKPSPVTVSQKEKE